MLADEVDTAYHEEVAEALVVVHSGVITSCTVRLAKSSVVTELVSGGTDLVHEILVEVGGLRLEPVAEEQVEGGPLTELVGGLLTGIDPSAVRLRPVMLDVVSCPGNSVVLAPFCDGLYEVFHPKLVESIEIVVSYLLAGAVELISLKVFEYCGNIGNDIVSAQLTEFFDNVIAERGCVGSVAVDICFILDLVSLLVLGISGLSGALILYSFLSGMAAFGGTWLAMVIMRYLCAGANYSGFAYYSWGLGLFAFILYLMV